MQNLGVLTPDCPEGNATLQNSLQVPGKLTDSSQHRFRQKAQLSSQSSRKILGGSLASGHPVAASVLNTAFTLLLVAADLFFTAQPVFQPCEKEPISFVGCSVPANTSPYGGNIEPDSFGVSESTIIGPLDNLVNNRDIDQV